MTQDQLLIVFAVLQAILRDLLTSTVGQAAADEIMDGGVTTAAPTGIVGDMITQKTAYDADPATYAATQASVDALDDVVDALTAVEIGDFAAASGDAYDALQAASPEV